MLEAIRTFVSFGWITYFLRNLRFLRIRPVVFSQYHILQPGIQKKHLKGKNSPSSVIFDKFYKFRKTFKRFVLKSLMSFSCLFIMLLPYRNRFETNPQTEFKQSSNSTKNYKMAIWEIFGHLPLFLTSSV